MQKTSEASIIAQFRRAWPRLVCAAGLLLCAEAQGWSAPGAPLAEQAGADRVVGPLRVAAAKASPPRAAGKASETAGRYSILRDGGKDTGCMLTLDDKAKAKGGDKASLAPGCRDQGIVIFDPVAWQIVNGRLVLTARKGHSTHLDQQPDGVWLKDPKEGKSLSLKKQ
jgi:hypothetical protein